MADDRFVIVPYMGTSTPSAGTIMDNGIRFNTEFSYWGCISTTGNNIQYATTYGTTNIMYSLWVSPLNGSSAVSTNGENVAVEALSSSSVINGIRMYYHSSGRGMYPIALGSNPKFASLNEALTAATKLAPPEGSMNIKYSIQNGSIIAPSWVSPGGNVTGFVTMQAGFSLTQQDISVTRNGTAIPFAYSNGVLTFTAPSS